MLGGGVLAQPGVGPAPVVPLQPRVEPGVEFLQAVHLVSHLPQEVSLYKGEEPLDLALGAGLVGSRKGGADPQGGEGQLIGGHPRGEFVGAEEAHRPIREDGLRQPPASQKACQDSQDVRFAFASAEAGSHTEATVIIERRHQVHFPEGHPLLFHQIQLPQFIGPWAHEGPKRHRLLGPGQPSRRQHPPHRLTRDRQSGFGHQLADLLRRAPGPRHLEGCDQFSDLGSHRLAGAPGWLHRAHSPCWR